MVHLAGQEGRRLEQFHDTPLAASLIYKASSSIRVPMPRFYDRDDVAMADIRRCAALEAAAAQ